MVMAEDNGLEGRISLWNSLTANATEAYLKTDPRVELKDELTLREAFERDLSFGTAGLRAAMGIGFNRMNSITVQLATQGVAEYVYDRHGEGAAVVIGYDHRHHSKEFATVAAQVLKLKGLSPLLYDGVTPTPWVPFAVQSLGASFGIMITASHNPAVDNGYKVYASNGCQIVSPTDKEISALIKGQNYRLWSITEVAIESNLRSAVMSDNYFEGLFDLIKRLMPDSSHNKPSIAYTPMHGVGGAFVEQMIERMSFKACLLPVPSQRTPHPDFPTVAFPNPEEGKGALKEAINFASENGLKLIFANDPDADRFNVAELQSNGEWHIFTGNEIAALFADFVWRHRYELYPSSGRFGAISSCVSSKFLNAMGQQEGFEVVQTMTGFKFLSNTAQQMESQGITVFFAYEEAIGYMLNKAVWDKDGVSALAFMLLIIDEVAKNQEDGLYSRLQSIYLKYSYFNSYNSYFVCRPVEKITRIFTDARRKLIEYGSIPSECQADLTGEHTRITIGDTTIYRIQDYPGSNMITLYLSEDGLDWITFRASGTEPKLKFYSELRCPLAEKEECAVRQRALVANLCEILLDVNGNGLVVKSE